MHAPSCALVTQLYILCNDQEDYIYLLGSRPNKNLDEDHEQLVMLSFALLKREKVTEKTDNSSEPIDILVQATNSSVSSYLLGKDLEIPVKYTTRHTIEKRTPCAQCARIFFSSKYLHSRDKLEESIFDPSLKTDQLTFNDLFNEFCAVRDQLNMEQANTKFCNQEMFNALIRIADCQHDKLIALLENNDIDHAAIMVEIARKIAGRTDKLSREIKKSITHMSSLFFELDLLKELIKLPSKTNLVIADINHILCLKNLLESDDFCVRNAYGVNNYVTALSQEELETIVTLPEQIEHKAKETTIYLVNDTQEPLRITEDGKKIDQYLASGKTYCIDPKKVCNVTIKYKGSFDFTAKSVSIKEIASQAQINDLMVHIIPTVLGITIGEIEPVLYAGFQRKQ
jgi:hypothetical protein